MGVHRVLWFVYKYDGDEDKRGAISQCVVENTEVNKLGLVVAANIGSGYGDGDGGKGGRDEYSRSRDSGLDLTVISNDE